MLHIKSHTLLRWLFFWWNFSSNCYSCKGVAVNLIPHYMIDNIYKTVKPSHLEKLEIKQNINNLMFQVLYIFSDWILIKQIIAFSTPFCCWVKQIFKKFCLEFWVGKEGMSKTAQIQRINIIYLKIFVIHSGNISKRKFNKHSGEK